MATLRDIADRVGVTPIVVSYALSNRPGNIRMSDARRKEIREIAKEMGYVGNRSARALATRKNRVLGLLVHYPRYERQRVGAYATIFNILEGMRSVGSQSGYQCIHAVSDLRSEAVFEMPDFIRERSVDAVAIYGYVHPAVVQQILATGLPCLHIGTNIEEGSGLCSVFADMDKAANLVMDQAVAAGINSIHLYLPNGPGPKKIVDNFLKYAAENHPQLRAAGTLGKGSRITYEEACEHGESFKNNPPELILATISELLPVMIGLKTVHTGIRFPEDIQMIGFAPEGYYRHRLGETGLLISQIILPNTEAGEVIARQLIDLIEKRCSRLQDSAVDCIFEQGETAPLISGFPNPPSTEQQTTTQNTKPCKQTIKQK